MALLLNVKYEEKEEAKQLGARWNATLKKWYVPDKKDYVKFSKWLEQDQTNTIVCDHFYIIEGKQTCFKCGKETRVIGFGIENYIEIYDDTYEYNADEIHIAEPSSEFPKEVLDILKKRYNFKESYSKTIQSTHLANRCEHCDMLQGNFFLFQEVESPFFIDSKEKGSITDFI